MSVKHVCEAAVPAGVVWHGGVYRNYGQNDADEDAAMNEQEWLKSTAPKPMVEFLKGKASDRKLRMFAVACCRRVWRSLRKTRSRKAVEVAEQYAEGSADAEKLYTVNAAAYNAFMDTDEQTIQHLASGLAADVALADAGQAATSATEAADVSAHVAVYGMDFDDYLPPTDATEAAYRDLRFTEQANLCCFLRCIFGNPFRSVSIHPKWLAWNDGTVRKIVQSLYEERAFDRMPILADALQDAGCDNEDILNHCRSKGPHVRGCWVVDLLTGRK